MTYTINKTDGTLLTNLSDGIIDSSTTSLSLLGRGVVNFGGVMAENLVHILENFASPSNSSGQPINTILQTPLNGQLWFNTYSTSAPSTPINTLMVWDSTLSEWKAVGNVDLSLYALINSPTFTGVPLAPTASNPTTNTNQIATTAFVQKVVSHIDLSAYALLNSPTFVGTPDAPTPISGDSSTRIATTAFVQNAIASGGVNLSGYALLNSPTFIGTPKAPTPLTSDNSTRIATTAFIRNYVQDLNLSQYALINSPTFTGTPEAPTPSSSDNSTKLATTAFVQEVVASITGVNLSGYALLNSPTFVGTPTAPTPSASDSSTKLATTAFVHTAINNLETLLENENTTVTGTYSNLIIRNSFSSTNTTIIVFADQLFLGEGTSSYFATDVDISINITVTATSTTSGRDTSTSVQDSTWYSIWIIYNPTTNTLLGLLSLVSLFENLNLPSGFTTGARVGWVLTWTDGTLCGVQQCGNKAWFSNSGKAPFLSNYLGTQVVTSGSETSGYNGVVPPTASEVVITSILGYYGSGYTIASGPGTSWGTSGFSNYNTPWVGGSNGTVSGDDQTNFAMSIPIDLSDYSVHTFGNSSYQCVGWTDNL